MHLINQLSKLKIHSSFFKKIWLSFNKKGSFTQNVAITFTGSFLIIIIQLLLTPVISRIYSPTDYGVFGVYNAIVFNLVSISTLTFPQAIIIAKNREDVKRLIILSIGFATIFSVLLAFVFTVFGSSIAAFLNVNELNEFLLIIPLIIIAASISEVLTRWKQRNGEFKGITAINTGNNLFVRLFYIAFGLLKAGSFNLLILGDILGRLVSGIALLVITYKRGVINTLLKISLIDIKGAFKSYINYPKFILPSIWINMMANQLPIYLFSIYFNSATVGIFAFASSLLDLPLRLVTNSIRPVFFQKSFQIHEEEGINSLRAKCIEILKYLTILSIIPLLIVLPFGTKIFQFIFGKEWEMAGLFASIMSSYYLVQFISTPLTPVFQVIKKEKKLLMFNVLLFCARLIVLLFAGIYGNEILSIKLYSIVNLFCYNFLLFQIFHVLKASRIKITIFSLIVSIVLALVIIFVI